MPNHVDWEVPYSKRTTSTFLIRNEMDQFRYVGNILRGTTLTRLRVGCKRNEIRFI